MSVLPPGSKLGRFEISGVLGQGAMGVVYLAHDPSIDRPVAIKTIRSEAARDDNAAEIPDTESIAAYAESSALLRGLRWFDFGIVLPPSISTSLMQAQVVDGHTTFVAGGGVNLTFAVVHCGPP